MKKISLVEIAHDATKGLGTEKTGVALQGQRGTQYNLSIGCPRGLGFNKMGPVIIHPDLGGINYFYGVPHSVWV